MATGIPARLNVREGRKFGLTVGTAFIVLGGISWWRGHVIPAGVLGGLGSILIMAGLILPSRLGPILRAWMGFAHLISKFTTPLFMGIVYFAMFTPVGFALRLLGKNPLARRCEVSGSHWVSRPPGSGGSRDMERQF